MPDPVRGVTSRGALLASGWDARSLRRELSSGRLVAVRRGIYAPARLLAIHNWLTWSLLQQRWSHGADSLSSVIRSAALLHGLDLLYRPNQVELTSPMPCQRSGSDVRVHVAALPAAQCDEVRGVPVTSVARTVVDVARTCTLQNALVVADSALHRRRTTTISYRRS